MFVWYSYMKGWLVWERILHVPICCERHTWGIEFFKIFFFRWTDEKNDVTMWHGSELVVTVSLQHKTFDQNMFLVDFYRKKIDFFVNPVFLRIVIMYRI